MVPRFVKPYVKTNKHDAADAEAICEAVTRPNMRFVPVKTPEQQAVLALHRSRQSFIKQRTAQANQFRGLLAEFGIIVPRGIQQLQLQLPEFLEDADILLPSLFRVHSRRQRDVPCPAAVVSVFATGCKDVGHQAADLPVFRGRASVMRAPVFHSVAYSMRWRSSGR